MAGLIELALPFALPSDTNKHLHDALHCTFDHGCHYLAFERDTDSMMDPDRDGHEWAQSLLNIGFIPLAILFIYMMIDMFVRCCARCACCCCGPSSGQQRGDDGVLLASTAYHGGGSMSGAGSPLVGGGGEVVHDRPGKGRLIFGILFGLISLALLFATLGYSSKQKDSYSDLQDNINDVDDYITGLQTNGIDAFSTDSGMTSQTITDMTIQAGGLSNFPPSVQSTIVAVNSSMINLASQLTSISDTLTEQKQHIADVKKWMNDIGKLRDGYINTVVVFTIAGVILMLILGIWAAQAGTIAFLVKLFLGLLVLGVSLIWAGGFVISIGLSDVCMAPQAYGNSLFNETIIHKYEGNLDDMLTINIIRYYYNCPFNPNPPADEYENNPLYPKVESAFTTFDSPDFNDKFNQMIGYINNNQSGLQSYVPTFVNLNTSLHNEVNVFKNAMMCEHVHNEIVTSLTTVCHPLVEDMWIISMLLIFAVLALMLMRQLIDFPSGVQHIGGAGPNAYSHGRSSYVQERAGSMV